MILRRDVDLINLVGKHQRESWIAGGHAALYIEFPNAEEERFKLNCFQLPDSIFPLLAPALDVLSSEKCGGRT